MTDCTGSIEGHIVEIEMTGDEILALAKKIVRQQCRSSDEDLIQEAALSLIESGGDEIKAYARVASLDIIKYRSIPVFSEISGTAGGYTISELVK